MEDTILKLADKVSLTTAELVTSMEQEKVISSTAASSTAPAATARPLKRCAASRTLKSRSNTGVPVSYTHLDVYKRQGLATAAKKASRTAAEGMVYADYCPQCKVGVVIEVNAETDFVAKNDKFVAFVKEATQVIMKQNPADVEALMACKTENGETEIGRASCRERVLRLV